MRVLSYIGFLLAIGVTARCLDPYAVLGVEEGSTIADIKRAYRRLSLKYHPDHGAAGSSCGEIGEKDMAVEMGSESESMGGDDDVVATCSVSWGDVDESDAFRRITEAYGLLKEGNTRRLYDKYGQEWATMHEYLSKADALGLVEIYDDDRYAESRAGQARRLITILHDENWQRHLVPTSQLNGLDEDTISESSSPDTAEDDYWAVIFYHPEVRECIKNKQRYHQIASTMAKAGEKVRFGVINCAMSPDLCTRFAVDAYDTILVFDKHQMSTKYLNYYIWDLEPELLPTISDWVDKKNRLPVLLNGDDHLTWWLAHNRETHKASLSQPDAPPPQGDNRASIIIHFTRTCRPCQEILRYIEAMDHGPHSPQHILVDCTAGQCDAPYYPYIQLLPPKNDLPSAKHGPQSHEAIPIDYHFKRHPIELILNLVSTIYGNADS